MGSNKYPPIPSLTGGTPHLPGPGQPGPMLPEEFAPGSIANVVTFGFDDVAPPSPLYIQRDDQIRFTLFANVADTVTFRLRFLRVPEPQGGQPSEGGVGKYPGKIFTRGIVETIERSFATSVGTTTIVQQPLAEGYILSVTAVGTSTVSRGRTWAQATIIRGGSSTAFSAFTLFADYVTAGAPTGYPGGRIVYPTEGPGWVHSQAVSAPAAGADWAFSTGGAQRVAVRSFNASLLTSAAVANRNIEVIVDDGVNVMWRTSVPTAVTASSTVNISATQSNQPTGVVTADPTALIPPGLILAPGGWRVRVATQNIQAADQWSNIWLNVEEWLDNF